MDMMFGIWNARSLYRSGSLTTVAREVGKCKLDLVGVQEVRWTRAALNGHTIIYFSAEKGMKITS
jgi:hypothetical protein